MAHTLCGTPLTNGAGILTFDADDLSVAPAIKGQTMAHDTSSELIFDLVRARGVIIRDYTLSVGDQSVVIGGKVQSYYHIQLCLVVVSSVFRGRIINNQLVVHSSDPVEFDAARVLGNGPEENPSEKVQS